MTGSRVALDTNHAIHVLNDVPAVISWLNAFDHLCVPVTVVGELLYGAMNSARSAENLAKVYALVARCHVWETTVRTSRTYAELRLDLKRRGRPVPENDLWIAAACVERDVALATD
jgi:tRNA(fMet)-specific endonuclease VapC